MYLSLPLSPCVFCVCLFFCISPAAGVYKKTPLLSPYSWQPSDSDACLKCSETHIRYETVTYMLSSFHHIINSLCLCVCLSLCETPHRLCSLTQTLCPQRREQECLTGYFCWVQALNGCWLKSTLKYGGPKDEKRVFFVLCDFFLLLCSVFSWFGFCFDLFLSPSFFNCVLHFKVIILNF